MAFLRFDKHRPVFVAVCYWAASVFVFSIVYYVLWSARPDSFIVNKEFNLTPYDELQSKLWADPGSMPWGRTPELRAPTSTDIDAFMTSVSELDRAATTALRDLEPLQNEQRRLEAERKVAFQKHSELLWANVERYKTAALAAETTNSKKASDFVTSLERQFGTAPNPYQAIAIANARVALAEARYREALKTAEVGDYVLRHLGSFADPKLADETRRLDDSLRENSQHQSELERQVRDLRGRAYSALRAWYTARQQRLAWVDFLYFSVGVSTTTTFGDIVSNSRLARVAVLLQLVLSVLIVGYLVSLLSPRQVQNGS
jgi:hypothetical protein